MKEEKNQFYEEKNIVFFGKTGRGKTFIILRFLDFIRIEHKDFELDLTNFDDVDIDDYCQGTKEIKKAVIYDHKNCIKYQLFSTIGFGHSFENGKTLQNSELMFKLKNVHHIFFCVFGIEKKFLVPHHEIILLLQDALGKDTLSTKSVVSVIWNFRDEVNTSLPFLKKLSAELGIKETQHFPFPELTSSKTKLNKAFETCRKIYEIIENSKPTKLKGYSNFREMMQKKISLKNKEISKLKFGQEELMQTIEQLRARVRKNEIDKNEMKEKITAICKENAQVKEELNVLKEKETKIQTDLEKSNKRANFLFSEKEKLIEDVEFLEQEKKELNKILLKQKLVNDDNHEELKKFFLDFYRDMDYLKKNFGKKEFQPSLKLSMFPILSIFSAFSNQKKFDKIKNFFPSINVTEEEKGTTKKLTVSLTMSKPLENKELKVKF